MADRAGLVDCSATWPLDTGAILQRPVAYCGSQAHQGIDRRHSAAAVGVADTLGGTGEEANRGLQDVQAVGCGGFRAGRHWLAAIALGRAGVCHQDQGGGGGEEGESGVLEERSHGWASGVVDALYFERERVSGVGGRVFEKLGDSPRSRLRAASLAYPQPRGWQESCQEQKAHFYAIFDGFRGLGGGAPRRFGKGNPKIEETGERRCSTSPLIPFLAPEGLDHRIKRVQELAAVAFGHWCRPAAFDSQFSQVSGEFASGDLTAD